LRDAKLVAWRIEPPVEAGKGRQPAHAAGAQGGSSAKPLTLDPPRLTRRVTIGPDGVVHWNLDHTIFDGIQKPGDIAYLYKLHSNLLDKREPVRPVLKPGGDEKPAVFAARREAAEQKYRQDEADYRALKQTVRQLPTDLSEQDVHRVWAIFDLRTRAGVKRDDVELTLAGAAPLPWGLSIGELAAVHGVAQPDKGKARGTLADWGDVLVRLMAAHPHPWTCRLSALAIAEAGVGPSAVSGQPLYEAMKTIMESDDAVARRCVMGEVARASRINKDLLDLLLLAPAHHDAAEQLVAVKALAGVDPADDALVQPAVAAMAQMFEDPAGAPADQEIQAMLANAKPGMADRLAGAIHFEALADGGSATSRRTQAVTAVVAHAVDNPLAAQWLQNSLLASKDATVVTATLSRLAAVVEAAPAGVGEPAKAVETAQPTVRAGRGKKAAEEAGPKLVVMEGIDGGLTAVLRQGTPEQQGLAWRGLPLFTAPEAGGGSKGGKADLDETIVQLALATHPTPPQVVAFLCHQTDGHRVGAGLVRLAVGGDDTVGVTAARALVGSGLPLNKIVPALDIAGRQALVERVYQAATAAPAPLAAGLIRDARPEGKVGGFFGERAAQGKLPTPAEWAGAYGPEDKLLAAIGASDEALGLAAAAGLVATVGGGEDQAHELANAVRGSGGSGDAARNAWFEVRQGVVTTRLKHAAGPYKMRLLVYGKLPKNAVEAPVRRGAPIQVTLTALKPGAKPPTVPPMSAGEEALAMVAHACNSDQILDLGTQTLVVQGPVPAFDGQPIGLSVPVGEYAIQIDRPKELTALPCDGWPDLALDRVTKPVILHPQGSGWEATFRLADGRIVQLVLESAAG
jgi:hypothetical protein